MLWEGYGQAMSARLQRSRSQNSLVRGSDHQRLGSGPGTTGNRPRLRGPLLGRLASSCCVKTRCSQQKHQRQLQKLQKLKKLRGTVLGCWTLFHFPLTPPAWPCIKVCSIECLPSLPLPLPFPSIGRPSPPNPHQSPPFVLSIFA